MLFVSSYNVHSCICILTYVVFLQFIIVTYFRGYKCLCNSLFVTLGYTSDKGNTYNFLLNKNNLSHLGCVLCNRCRFGMLSYSNCHF